MTRTTRTRALGWRGVGCGLLVACGLLVVQATSAEAASVVLKLGHVAGPTSIHQFAGTHIAERVKNYTKGEVEIQIFPSIQLGDEEEQFKAMQTGVQQMGILTLNNQSGFYPAIDVFYLPFLFRDERQAHEVFDGPFGQKMADRFRAATGVRLLGYYEIGFRQFWTNKRAVSKPADLQGVILRIPKNPIGLATARVFGATAVPMAWSEVVPALRGGVVDGIDLALPDGVSEKIFEVTKFLSMTNHLYVTQPVYIAERTFQSLSKAQQDAIVRAVREVAPLDRAEAKRRADEAGTILREKGMTINAVDVRPFRELAAKVWKEFEGRLGGDVVKEATEATAK